MGQGPLMGKERTGLRRILSVWSEEVWSEEVWSEEVWSEEVWSEKVWSEEVWSEEVWSEEMFQKVSRSFKRGASGGRGHDDALLLLLNSSGGEGMLGGSLERVWGGAGESHRRSISTCGVRLPHFIHAPIPTLSHARSPETLMRSASTASASPLWDHTRDRLPTLLHTAPHRSTCGQQALCQC